MIGVFLPSVVKRSPTGHSASTNVPSSGSAASAIMRLAHRLVTASETLLAPARTTSVISTRYGSFQGTPRSLTFTATPDKTSTRPSAPTGLVEGKRVSGREELGGGPH